jgi:hypothetical protein
MMPSSVITEGRLIGEDSLARAFSASGEDIVTRESLEQPHHAITYGITSTVGAYREPVSENPTKI